MPQCKPLHPGVGPFVYSGTTFSHIACRLLAYHIRSQPCSSYHSSKCWLLFSTQFTKNASTSYHSRKSAWSEACDAVCIWHGNAETLWLHFGWPCHQQKRTMCPHKCAGPVPDSLLSNPVNWPIGTEYYSTYNLHFLPLRHLYHFQPSSTVGSYICSHVSCFNWIWWCTIFSSWTFPHHFIFLKLFFCWSIAEET